MSSQSYAHEKTAKAFDTVQAQIAKRIENPDPDGVHDLRVSIRRLSEAMREFKPLLNPSARRRVKRTLKGVMSLAGDTRDYDIAIESAGEFGVHFDELGRRREHSAHLLVSRLKAAQNVLPNYRENLLAPDGTTPETVNPIVDLPAKVKRYVKAGEKVVHADGNRWKALHKFRIESKRMRYALELYAPLKGQEIDDLIGKVKKVQTALGHLQDDVATRKLLKPIDGSAEIRGELKKRMHQRLDKVKDVWTEEFGQNGSAKKAASEVEQSTPAPRTKTRIRHAAAPAK